MIKAPRAGPAHWRTLLLPHSLTGHGSRTFSCIISSLRKKKRTFACIISSTAARRSPSEPRARPRRSPAPGSRLSLRGSPPASAPAAMLPGCSPAGLPSALYRPLHEPLPQQPRCGRYNRAPLLFFFRDVFCFNELSWMVPPPSLLAHSF